ncbi:uncharacterized protein TNCV_4228531 [Trichonephila clavipes]|nr:uncharacterized protein TNCV_4228531 [Trichonephila clavipes]
MCKDEVGMSIGCLMLMIIEEIGEIRKLGVDQVMAEGGNYENGRQGNQWLESRNRFQKDDRRFNDRGYQFRNGSQKDDFCRRTTEIGVRGTILVETIGGKEDD